MSKLHISVAPEVVAHIGGLGITNSLITSLVVMSILVLIAFKARNVNSARLTKSKFYVATEMVIEEFYGFLKNIAGEKITSLFPLLFTFFLFIILSNWIGLLPGVGSIGFYEHTDHGEIFIPLFRGPNADLNVTLALTFISVITTQVLSISALGIKKYLMKFFNFTNPMKAIVGILELISEFSKVLSFSFRLFGNIFAGEVLLMVMVFLVPLFVPVPFLFLEVFVGFIQALVFTMLTTIFIVVGTQHHDG